MCVATASCLALLQVHWEIEESVVKKRKNMWSLLRWADLYFTTSQDVPFSMESMWFFENSFPCITVGLPVLRVEAQRLECVFAHSWRWSPVSWGPGFDFVEWGIWMQDSRGWGRDKRGKRCGCCQLGGALWGAELSQGKCSESLISGVWYESSSCHFMKSAVHVRFHYSGCHSVKSVGSQTDLFEFMSQLYCLSAVLPWSY